MILYFYNLYLYLYYIILYNIAFVYTYIYIYTYYLFLQFVGCLKQHRVGPTLLLSLGHIGKPVGKLKAMKDAIIWGYRIPKDTHEI